MAGCLKTCPHCGEQAWDGDELKCGYTHSGGKCSKVRPCPQCKGERGEGYEEPLEFGGMKRGWRKCVACDGRGTVRPEPPPENDPVCVRCLMERQAGLEDDGGYGCPICRDLRAKRDRELARRKSLKGKIKGFRGEPWSTDGREIFDRHGEPFAKVYKGGEEFAQTIVACVNALTNVPLRPDDGSPTEFQKHALEILASEARKWGDDPR